MRLEVIDSLGALEQFRNDWAAFAETIVGMTPFQLPAWLFTWWRHFGSGRLCVLVFRTETALAGVVPLFQHEWQGRSQITLIGSGISDYLEPGVTPRHREEVIDGLREYLHETGDWDICDWQDLNAETSLGALGRVQEDTPCSEIKLTGRFEEYCAHRSKDLRRNLRRYGDRAEQTGSVEFAVTCRADTGLIAELIQLHRDRWQKQDQPGMIAANNSADFLCDVARGFERFTLLRVFTLRFEGKTTAISIGFLYRGTLYSYLSAFDPQYEILGFGRRLLYESLRYAYQQQYTAWNFCRGEEPYKCSFGAERIPKRRVIIKRAGSGID